MALLEIKDIHKSFGNLNVLNVMDLTVNKGDVIAILGPSGSGKTTLLRCINYLETADAGTMIFNGKSYDLSNTSKKDVAQLRKHTGFVFQNYNLFANILCLLCCLSENILFYLYGCCILDIFFQEVA